MAQGTAAQGSSSGLQQPRSAGEGRAWPPSRKAVVMRTGRAMQTFGRARIYWDCRRINLRLPICRIGMIKSLCCQGFACPSGGSWGLSKHGRDGLCYRIHRTVMDSGLNCFGSTRPELAQSINLSHRLYRSITVLRQPSVFLVYHTVRRPHRAVSPVRRSFPSAAKAYLCSNTRRGNNSEQFQHLLLEVLSQCQRRASISVRRRTLHRTTRASEEHRIGMTKASSISYPCNTSYTGTPH